MSKATVQERGQVTIPKTLRDRLGLKPGTVLEFREDHGRLVGHKVEPADPIDEIFGMAGTGRRTDDIIRELRGEE